MEVYAGRMSHGRRRVVKQGKTLILLHLMLMCYSVSGILSKVAATQPFFSRGFYVCYGGIIAILGLYALVWQQIIRRLPLTMAFTNKAVTIVWGMVWGVLFFQESVTLGKIAGIALVVSGVVLFSMEKQEEKSK